MTTRNAELDVAIESFDDMDLDDSILRGVYSHGFERPSAIQQRAIRPLMLGHDVIGQSQSGTGKTAAFGIGSLSRIDFSRVRCQALLLAPTRELAMQNQKVCVALGDYVNLRCHGCIGGTKE